MSSINRDSLNDLMAFDHVIRVHDDGTVTEPKGIWAPELHDGELSQGGTAGTGWSLMDGWSGQYGYSGPMMHQSEFIGGRMADHILTTPGLYVALVDYCDDDDNGPTEWAVAFKLGEMKCE